MICYYNQAGSGDPTIYTQYDYAGQDRVSKLVRTGTLASPIYERTIYIDGIFEYVKLENGSTYEKNYIRMMDDKSNIAEIRINNGAAFPGDIADDVVYNLEDQIGSSTIRLDINGTIIDKEEYYPFGDSSLRTFTYKRYRYVGKERDAESGLYYYGARYYAAWTGRFISVDPLSAKYAQLSPYNYADNNPINDYDIDGMQNNNSSGTPTSAPTGSAGNTAVSNGSSGGCMTCPATAATSNTATTKNEPTGSSLRAAGTEGGGGATTHQNLAAKKPKNIWEYNSSSQAVVSTDTRTEFQKAEDQKYTEEVEWSNPRAVAANLLESVNVIGHMMDIYSYTQNETDRKGRDMSPDQFAFKVTGVVLTFTPIKVLGGASKGAVQLGPKTDLFLIYASRATQPSGMLNVAVHGSPLAVQIGENMVNHRVLARLIQSNPEFTGQPIRLLSCNTGALENGLAKNLANKMGLPVEAPTNIIWAFSDGSLTIGATPFVNNGKFVWFWPGK